MATKIKQTGESIIKMFFTETKNKETKEISLKRLEISELHQHLPILNEVTRVDLSFNFLNDKSLKTILKLFPNVEELNLSHNYIGNLGLGFILNEFMKIENLNLSYNLIGDKGLMDLKKVPKYLDLQSNYINGTALAKLFTHPNLVRLNLSRNQISNKFLKNTRYSINCN